MICLFSHKPPQQFDKLTSMCWKKFTRWLSVVISWWLNPRGTQTKESPRRESLQRAVSPNMMTASRGFRELFDLNKWLDVVLRFRYSSFTWFGSIWWSCQIRKYAISPLNKCWSDDEPICNSLERRRISWNFENSKDASWWPFLYINILPDPTTTTICTHFSLLDKEHSSSMYLFWPWCNPTRPELLK